MTKASIEDKGVDVDEGAPTKSWHFSSLFSQKTNIRPSESKRQKIKSFFKYYLDLKPEKEDKQKHIIESEKETVHHIPFEEKLIPKTKDALGTVTTVTKHSIFTKIRNLSSSLKSPPIDYDSEQRLNRIRNQQEQLNRQNSMDYENLSLRKKIKKRLSQKTLSEDQQNLEVVIPSEIVTTITECLFDQRTIETIQSDSFDLNLDLNSERSIMSIEEQSKFSPLAKSNTINKSPPKSLPKEKHAKWERSQMLRQAVIDFDHAKWKSSHSLHEQENSNLYPTVKYDKRVNSGTCSEFRSDTKRDSVLEPLSYFFSVSKPKNNFAAVENEISIKKNTRNNKKHALKPTEMSASCLHNQNFNSINAFKSKKFSFTEKDVRYFTRDQICYPLKKNLSCKADIINPSFKTISKDFEFQF